MAESTVLYLVMALQRWSEQEVQGLGLPVAARMGDGSIAYVPVFDDVEEAMDAYPGKTVLPIRYTPETK